MLWLLLDVLVVVSVNFEDYINCGCIIMFIKDWFGVEICIYYLLELEVEMGVIV